MSTLAVKQELDAVQQAELDRLKRLIPEGSTGMRSPYGGDCLVCGSSYPASKLLMRLLMSDEEGQIRGPKVCRFCSPYIGDEMVYRYTLEIDEWDDRWLNHLDSNTQMFNGKVVCVN